MQDSFLALLDKYDVLIILDADGQHRPNMIPKFVAAMKDNDIVSGSRYLDCDRTDVTPESRRKINQEITAWFNQKFGLFRGNRQGVHYNFWTNRALQWLF